MRAAANTAILIYLAERVSASAAAIGTACGLAPGEVRSRLAHLGSLRHITGRQDAHPRPPGRVFLITAEGRRRIEI